MAFSLRYLILPLVALAPITAFNQTVGPSEVAVQFTVFSRLRPTGLCYLPKSQSHPVALRFFTQNKSALYAYAGPRTLNFYNEAEWARYAELNATTHSAARPKPMAVASLPAGEKQLLLLFIPIPDAHVNELKFHVLAVPDDLERFPWGTLAVINVSGRVFKGSFSRQVLDMPLGCSENVAAEGALDIHLVSQDDGQWIASGQHLITVTPNNRVRMILFPAVAKTGIAPTIRTLTDDVPTSSGSETTTAAIP
jgi:hypothetical protein